MQSTHDITANLKTVVLSKPGYSIEELAAAYAVSQPLLRLEVKRGRLKALRFGRRIVVTREAWQEYLAQARTA